MSSTFGSDAGSSLVDYSWGGAESAPAPARDASPLAVAMRWWEGNGHSVALVAVVALVGVVLLNIVLTEDPSIESGRRAGELAAKGELDRASAFAAAAASDGPNFEPDYDALYGNDLDADLLGAPGLHRRASPIPDKSRRASRAAAASRCPPAVLPGVPENRLETRAVGMATLDSVFRKDGLDFVGVSCGLRK